MSILVTATRIPRGFYQNSVFSLLSYVSHPRRRSLSLTSPVFVNQSLQGSRRQPHVEVPRDDTQAQGWHNPGPGKPDDPIERLKHPNRGGQSLGDRYKRLERSLRGKSEYRKEIDEYSASNVEDRHLSSREEPVAKASGAIGAKKAQVVFAGLAIPEEPKAPEPDECCMSGCAICVHDLYAESLESYTKALESIRDALRVKGIPDSDWPRQLSGKVEKEVKKNISLSAFEQMELQLAARKEEAARDEGKVQIQASSNHATSLDTARKGSNGKNKERAFDLKDVWTALSWVLFSRR